MVSFLGLVYLNGSQDPFSYKEKSPETSGIGSAGSNRLFIIHEVSNTCVTAKVESLGNKRTRMPGKGFICSEVSEPCVTKESESWEISDYGCFSVQVK
jgi:hypothetical protein